MTYTIAVDPVWAEALSNFLTAMMICGGILAAILLLVWPIWLHIHEKIGNLAVSLWLVGYLAVVIFALCYLNAAVRLAS